MPSIYDIKPAFQNLLRPLTRALARAGVTANQVTIAALLGSVAVGAVISIGHDTHLLLLLVPLWLFLRMALNAIDGMLAREHGMKSRLGAILNELGDVVSDTALYLPFAYIPGIDPRLVVAVVVLAIMTEMAGIVALQVGAERRYDGPMGKSDRAFMFGVIALATGCGIKPGLWLHALFSLAIVLLILTIVNRSRQALDSSDSR